MEPIHRLIGQAPGHADALVAAIVSTAGEILRSELSVDQRDDLRATSLRHRRELVIEVRHGVFAAIIRRRQHALTAAINDKLRRRFGESAATVERLLVRVTT